MNYCLPKKQANEFRRALMDGRIDPEKLSEMSSKERRELFKGIVGEENAKDVNALFESKLLLKNQQQGLMTWAENVLGMRPKAKRDLISRIERMDKVLTADNEKGFLNDLAEQKLGVGISYTEAQKITELSEEVQKTREAMENGGERLDYGRAQVQLNNYVNDLKLNANKFKWVDLKRPAELPGKVLSGIAGTAKSIQASMDNSAIFRQGWRTLWAHPTIWVKNAGKTFSALTTYREQEKVLDELNADILSRPTYDLMRKAKLDVGVDEEAYPTSLPEKIPLIGRIYKASENAYTGFVRKTRADVFDKYIDIAEKTGVDLTDDELHSIGKMVNALTGRGDLGKLENAGKTINNFFFSPKFVKSHLDVLSQPITGAGGSNFVRKQSALNLLKIIAGTAAIMAIAKALAKAFDLPDPIELDPRSADFGKIKVRNTRFDVTGGMGSIFVLAARLATMSSKSSVTDKVQPLNATDKNGKPKFGATTGDDVIEDFIENKLSPVGQVVRDVLKGETRDKEKPTILNESLGLVTPLPVKTSMELWKDPNSAPFVISMIADGLGISTNTYGGSKDIKKQIEDAEARGDKQEVKRLQEALKETLKIEAAKAQRLEEQK